MGFFFTPGLGREGPGGRGEGRLSPRDPAEAGRHRRSSSCGEAGETAAPVSLGAARPPRWPLSRAVPPGPAGGRQTPRNLNFINERGGPAAPRVSPPPTLPSSPLPAGLGRPPPRGSRTAPPRSRTGQAGPGRAAPPRLPPAPRAPGGR